MFKRPSEKSSEGKSGDGPYYPAFTYAPSASIDAAQLIAIDAEPKRVLIPYIDTVRHPLVEVDAKTLEDVEATTKKVEEILSYVKCAEWPRARLVDVAMRIPSFSSSQIASFDNNKLCTEIAKYFGDGCLGKFIVGKEIERAGKIVTKEAYNLKNNKRYEARFFDIRTPQRLNYFNDVVTMSDRCAVTGICLKVRARTCYVKKKKGDFRKKPVGVLIQRVPRWTLGNFLYEIQKLEDIDLKKKVISWVLDTTVKNIIFLEHFCGVAITPRTIHNVFVDLEEGPIKLLGDQTTNFYLDMNQKHTETTDAELKPQGYIVVKFGHVSINTEGTSIYKNTVTTFMESVKTILDSLDLHDLTTATLPTDVIDVTTYVPSSSTKTPRIWKCITDREKIIKMLENEFSISELKNIVFSLKGRADKKIVEEPHGENRREHLITLIKKHKPTPLDWSNACWLGKYCFMFPNDERVKYQPALSTLLTRCIVGNYEANDTVLTPHGRGIAIIYAITEKYPLLQEAIIANKIAIQKRSARAKIAPKIRLSKVFEKIPSRFAMNPKMSSPSTSQHSIVIIQDKCWGTLADLFDLIKKNSSPSKDREQIIDLLIYVKENLKKQVYLQRFYKISTEHLRPENIYIDLSPKKGKSFVDIAQPYCTPTTYEWLGEEEGYLVTYLGGYTEATLKKTATKEDAEMAESLFVDKFFTFLKKSGIPEVYYQKSDQ